MAVCCTQHWYVIQSHCLCPLAYTSSVFGTLHLHKQSSPRYLRPCVPSGHSLYALRSGTLHRYTVRSVDFFFFLLPLSSPYHSRPFCSRDNSRCQKSWHLHPRKLKMIRNVCPEYQLILPKLI